MKLMCSEKRQVIDEKLLNIEQGVHTIYPFSVPKLMVQTGLSRGVFYKNSTVRKLVDEAVEKQAGMVDP